uniref:C2H2-type domain-containing protein n=1 Tax=Anabas testudineus TaxID=64144 RepID=A0A7N6AV30_ANATE
MSVWNEDFSSSQQQHCEQDNRKHPQTEKEQEELPSSQEEGQLQELEEDNTIRFIFTTPLVKDELDPLQSSHQSTKGEGDPLPSTSRHLMVHVHRKDLEPNSTSGNDCVKKTTTSPTKRQQPRTICEVCGKMFHSMVSLVNHAKSHATDLCGVCGTRFDSEDNLKLHLKTHKNGKVCEVCGKCFDSQGNLEMHMRIHTGEKPFLCSECGKSFNCRLHMKSWYSRKRPAGRDWYGKTTEPEVYKPTCGPLKQTKSF